jgi:hypothetical protein
MGQNLRPGIQLENRLIAEATRKNNIMERSSVKKFCEKFQCATDHGAIFDGSRPLPPAPFVVGSGVTKCVAKARRNRRAQPSTEKIR